jgi:tetratricopeptide (TPR) repeat protein
VGLLVKKTLVLLVAISALVRPASAQLPEAEDAFARGDYRIARLLYDSVLRLDSLSPRALYRLAVLDSWDGKLARSLGRFTLLRRIEPADADIMVAHARVLSWAGRTRWSEALYDSVLATSPDRVDALAGRARAVAWDGDLDRAEALWRGALERHPDEPELLLGLAQTLYWIGQPGQAEEYAARARALAPNDQTVRDLFDQVRSERRPVLALSLDAANDIDHNSFVALTGAFGASLRPDLRGTLRASWRQNDDRTNTDRSSGLDGWLVKSLRGGASLRVGLGARRLDPVTGSTRTFLTAQLGGGFRPAKSTSVAVGYGHYPFDETTALVNNGFVWDEIEIDAEWSPRSNVDVSAVANGGWLSDGNRRLIGVLAGMVGVARGLRVGGYARVMGYREANPGRGYFAPDRFSLGEGRAVYVWRRHGWSLRANGAFGAQQVGTASPTQAEWHADLTIARSWRAVDELALVGTYSNSALAQSANATTLAYRYWSVGLRYRRGL